VDIISLSFSLVREDPDVQKAIALAFTKPILIFAAASNDGGNHGVTYPAHKDEVICIYATDGRGNQFEGNPTQMENCTYHFASLGVAVKSAWPRKLSESTLKPSQTLTKRMTGTSFATPIAASTAANIINFAVMHGLEENMLQFLKSRQGMQRVLRGLMAKGERRSGLHYLRPWEMFEGRTNDEVIYSLKDMLVIH
jgi:subtilisin family serine protease